MSRRWRGRLPDGLRAAAELRGVPEPQPRIVNLFPIPALDGGHFLTLCVEAVRGKPLTPTALRYTQNVGIILLLLLMLLATKNDIVRVIFGG